MVRGVGLVALLALACRPAPAPEQAVATTPVVSVPVAPSAPPDFAELASRMSPAVVSVISALPPEDGRKSRRARRGIGSGMVVRADGQVLTNHHVIADAVSFAIEYADGARVAARLVYGDPRLDLALIAPEAPQQQRTAAPLSERAARAGEWVMAIGHPFGLGDTVTVGVISGLGRDHEDLGSPPGLDPQGIWSFIQTDASINLGNSGGPLVDLRGEVIGLTTAVRSDGQGVAFAVPAPMARKFLDEVWTHGRFRHARLGVEVGDLEDHAAVQILKVAADGPGARAGLLAGDVIVAADEARVRRVSDLAYLGRLRGVGAPLRLQVRRGADRLALQVVADEAL